MKLILTIICATTIIESNNSFNISAIITIFILQTYFYYRKYVMNYYFRAHRRIASIKLKKDDKGEVK